MYCWCECRLVQAFSRAIWRSAWIRQEWSILEKCLLVGFSQLSSLCTNAKEYYECAKKDDANLYFLTLNGVLSTSLSEKLRLQGNVHQIIFIFMKKVFFAHDKSLHRHQNVNYGFSSVGLNVIFSPLYIFWIVWKKFLMIIMFIGFI